MNEEILTKHFRNPDEIVHDIYRNGGVSVHGYGFISGGYGGGIDIDQAHRLMWVDGYLVGLMKGNENEGKELLRALNKRLQEQHPDVKDEQLPFINL